jgi:hypothetical protein
MRAAAGDWRFGHELRPKGACAGWALEADSRARSTKICRISRAATPGTAPGCDRFIRIVMVGDSSQFAFDQRDRLVQTHLVFGPPADE